MTENDPHETLAPLTGAMHKAAEAAERAPLEAKKAARKEGRRWYIAAVVAALLIAVASLYLSAQNTRALDTEQAARISSEGAAANQQLAARGQAPVPIPDANAAPSDALVAAATARVLASLPPTQTSTPSTTEIAQGIAAYMTAHPVSATPDQIAEGISAYLAVHPPAGGPAPSADAIRAAVHAEYAANPPPPGKDGAPGQPGQPGKDGTPGRDGKDGATGPSGAPGQPGKDGAAGPMGSAGPACPSGTHLAPVRFLSGQTGQGCVDDTQTTVKTGK